MPQLSNRMHQLDIPLEADTEKGWKPYHVFHGSTSDNRVLSCHVSVLNQGKRPHPPHRHAEEEIFLVLAGEVDLILPDRGPLQGGERQRLGVGQLVYYPVGYPHTLEAVSKEPAHYIMFKWLTHPARKTSVLPLGIFSAVDGPSEVDRDPKNGFRTRLVFEGPTAYLRKLHCHASVLVPLAGYEPHLDPYDVAIVVLEGKVETLGKILGPNGVIFYAAGEPHGMRNPAETAARYVVFEFHAERRTWQRSLAELTDVKSLKRRLRSLVKRLQG
jgi:mannose-6-phosphate isomerase-like protein (cupin superfamily)